MCGIIGIISKDQVGSRLLQGLERLEYRGYDSSGIAVFDDSKIHLHRAEGKIKNLANLMAQQPLQGTSGIGHTRWATHGAPILKNAHPHCTNQLALVHNGIIENYQALRQSLEGAQISYQSDTDSEVVAHLITDHLNQGKSPAEAVRDILPLLKGAFALAMMFVHYDGMMIAARRGSPLAIGYGDGEMFLGSDALALAPFTQKISYLKEGDWVVLTPDGATIYDVKGDPVTRDILINSINFAQMEMGNYSHFMEKEIHEQPGVISQTLQSILDQQTLNLNLGDFPFDPNNIQRMIASACGTAFYSCMVGKYWIESLSQLSMDVDIASELRYRDTPLNKKDIALFISQSGETMDSLEAMRHAQQAGLTVLSVVNVPESTMMRESALSLLTRAGPEIGVASTKAFTTQLTMLLALAIEFGRARNVLPQDRAQHLVQHLIALPSLMQEILTRWDEIGKQAQLLVDAKAVFYMGRGNCYPIALEGALKLKEISYIHAEGYAAGEMKHGPIALIDRDLPVIMLAPSGPLLPKIAANVQEIVARAGKVILFADQEAADFITKQTQPTSLFIMPAVDPVLAPILYSLPMQILAYETALLKGTDIDKPRNLAKSVTVE
ncbi:MAG: glutamine--fructose-6-phosphate transaminase (isomerizing) [Alphaproteobacteria bacterium]